MSLRFRRTFWKCDPLNRAIAADANVATNMRRLPLAPERGCVEVEK